MIAVPHIFPRTEPTLGAPHYRALERAIGAAEVCAWHAATPLDQPQKANSFGPGRRRDASPSAADRSSQLRPAPCPRAQAAAAPSRATAPAPGPLAAEAARARRSSTSARPVGTPRAAAARAVRAPCAPPNLLFRAARIASHRNASHIIASHRTASHSIAQHRTAQPASHRTAQHSIASHSTAQHSIA